MSEKENEKCCNSDEIRIYRMADVIQSTVILKSFSNKMFHTGLVALRKTRNTNINILLCCLSS